MRASSILALPCVVWMIALACGSSDGRKPAPEPRSGAGGEPANGGSGGSAARSGSSTGARSGSAGEAGNAGDAGSAGDAGGGGVGDGGVGGGGPDVCAACPTQCLDDGTCVECLNDGHCVEPSPFCETGDHVCVECLPSDDQCPAGSYCSSSFECVAGCKDGPSCASGACLPSHDCDHCIFDTECAAARVCATGECTALCTGEGQSCGGGRTCCAGHCVDTSRDIVHCGGCDTQSSMHACGSDEFCGTMGCAGAVVAALCQNARVALVRDALPPDVAAGTVIGTALSACASAPIVRSVAAGVLDVANPSTGQPVAGPGELLVVAGGPFGQVGARFLQDQRIAGIRQVLVENRYEMQRSADDSVVGSMPSANATATHDLVVFEAVRDPASGTLVFIVAGFNESGTGAGAWYFQNVMMPALTSFTKSWYVYEWTDGGDNQLPDTSDTFTRLGEAP